MGIAGAVIVMSQMLSSFQSSQKFTDEILKFKEEFQSSQIEREKYFVRKSDINPLITKMDQMNDQLIRMTEQIKSLRNDYAENEYDDYGEETCSIDGPFLTTVLNGP